ncbi:MAG: transposase [Bacteroidales bacterium]|nr:transposase [Bacteroidales bacterium]
MANTYFQLYIHIVFAVSQRDAMILEPWRDDLYRYIGGAVRNNECELVAIGGIG